MKIYMTDRIENGIAVCQSEKGERIEIPTEIVRGINEGDVIVEENGEFRIDKQLTDERRKKIIELQNNLWE